MSQESVLEMVERHVRQGGAHIARQKTLIEELRALSLPTLAAEAFLRVLEDTLVSHRTHAERLRLKS
jgi:hypothetical protein